MKAITMYIADDGREFKSEVECMTYEKNTLTILAMIKEHEGNPSEAMIALMKGVKEILGINIVSYDGYVKLFREHRPCAYACTLWKVFSDYHNDYPTLYSAYSAIMNEYISRYGEPKK